MVVKVLVVDDSGFFRRRVSEILSADPTIQVIGTATNGKEAIDLNNKHRPDLAILDINMPIMDGLTAAETIVQTTPVLMLTAFSQRELVERANAAAPMLFGTFEYQPTMSEIQNNRKNITLTNRYEGGRNSVRGIF